MKSQVENLPDPPPLPEPGEPLDLKPHIEYITQVRVALEGDLRMLRIHCALLIATWTVILGGIGYGIYLLVR